MSTAKLLLIIFSALTCYLVFQSWTTVPIIGEVNGINNGAGIVTLLCSGVIIIGSCIFYMQTINEAKQAMINASEVTMFGVPIGQKAIGEDTSIFAVKPSVYFICVLSIINIAICWAYDYFPPVSTITEVQESE